MSEPADGVALAAAGRMFDEVVVAHALASRGLHELPHGLKLVVAGENHRRRLDLSALLVPLLVNLQMDESGEQVEQAVSLEHLFPQGGGAIRQPGRIGWVPRATVAALVEWKEVCCGAGEAGGHQHQLGVCREVNQCSPLELENQVAWGAILFVLPAGILDPLARERVLQFHGGDGDAIQAQRHIE